MSPVEGIIRVNSNLLRNPHVFDQLGPLAGALARDIMIFCCWKKQKEVLLHLPEFCEVMGYNRQHLLRPIKPAQVAQLRQGGWLEEDLPKLSNTIMYTICRMLNVNLVFPEPYEHPQKVESKAKFKKRDRFYTKKSMVSQVLAIKPHKTGTLIQFRLDDEVIDDLADLYQNLDMAEYRGLKTTGGHADDQARRVFMYCVWKRQYWDSKSAEAGIYPSMDSYRHLLAVAGLQHHNPQKRAASLLRLLLRRIGKMASVRMTPTVEMDYAQGVYIVRWSRDLNRVEMKEARAKAKADMMAARRQVA